MNKLSLLFAFFSVGLVVGTEILSYEVIQKISNSIEVRKYGATKWATTTAKCSAEQCSTVYQYQSFMKLYKYITGQNDAKQNIPMTAPVTMSYQSSNGAKIATNSEVSYEMGFFVPKEFQNKTPNPTGDNMSIKSDSGAVYAVSRFGGYAGLGDYLKHRDLIIQALGVNAANYDTTNFIAAGYDSPFNFFNRRNEVWLKKIK